MTERQKQAVFLKNLLCSAGSEEHRHLHERITNVEKDVRCMKGACKLAGLAVLAALAGLGYCAVLLPEFFDNTVPLPVRVLRALALASGVSLVGFFAMTMRHCRLLHQLHDEARQLVASLVQLRPTPILEPSATVVVHEGDTAVYQIRTESHAPASNPDLVTLPKAS